MDTHLIIIGLIVAAGIFLLVALSRQIAALQTKTARIKTARARALKYHQEQDLDRLIKVQHPVTVNFLSDVEVDDRFDGRGKLTDAEYKIINKILND